MKRSRSLFILALLGVSNLCYGAASAGHYNRGVELYQAGRFSDATDSFEQAVKRKDHAQEAQNYIERIRRETVERIRNRALTGVKKDTWRTKYYYMVVTDGRVKVGISAQEMFERESLNFRPGALDALHQLAKDLQRAENTRVDVDLINEVNQGNLPNSELLAQQLTSIFSYLSLSARNVQPKY